MAKITNKRSILEHREYTEFNQMFSGEDKTF